MGSGIQGNVVFPWSITALAISLLAIFFSPNIVGVDWWKLAIPAAIVAAISLFAMFYNN